ncbi:hypothetical protein CC1G_07938 [Coprinopsis cinerea okayama7|uniref:Uncharacterized protein n=1 Tax=Coprinopsis cinerea (strain Okayama-7 / 130 / ATCC MYA-4618 / FGSC 9003) TaxID=240176 RepID=A8P1Y1_COPC7|nr:hypothetical protein CC1G_07938 [Coprinopsis cinerea okayama7\|eukprot:XP_001838197.1 hypothetical protein CC1G_07938 [Coprinopsis cinerea okayama7\
MDLSTNQALQLGADGYLYLTPPPSSSLPAPKPLSIEGTTEWIGNYDSLTHGASGQQYITPYQPLSGPVPGTHRRDTSSHSNSNQVHPRNALQLQCYPSLEPISPHNPLKRLPTSQHPSSSTKTKRQRQAVLANPSPIQSRSSTPASAQFSPADLHLVNLPPVPATPRCRTKRLKRSASVQPALRSPPPPHEPSPVLPRSHRDIFPPTPQSEPIPTLPLSSSSTPRPRVVRPLPAGRRVAPANTGNIGRTNTAGPSTSQLLNVDPSEITNEELSQYIHTTLKEHMPSTNTNMPNTNPSTSSSSHPQQQQAHQLQQQAQLDHFLATCLMYDPSAEWRQSGAQVDYTEFDSCFEPWPESVRPSRENRVGEGFLEVGREMRRRLVGGSGGGARGGAGAGAGAASARAGRGRGTAVRGGRRGGTRRPATLQPGTLQPPTLQPGTGTLQPPTLQPRPPALTVAIPGGGPGPASTGTMRPPTAAGRVLAVQTVAEARADEVVKCSSGIVLPRLYNQ